MLLFMVPLSEKQRAAQIAAARKRIADAKAARDARAAKVAKKRGKS